MKDTDVIQIRKISSCLADNRGIFESNGFSRIGVTVDGKKKVIELPIKSNGIDDVTRELASQAPRPPMRERLIKADSDEGKKLGLEKDTGLMFFDTTDEGYLQSLEEHGKDVIWKTIIAGLAVEFEGLKTFEEKKAALIGQGIIERQIQKIYSDILRLTAYAGDREDFLPGKA